MKYEAMGSNETAVPGENYYEKQNVRNDDCLLYDFIIRPSWIRIEIQ